MMGVSGQCRCSVDAREVLDVSVGVLVVLVMLVGRLCWRLCVSWFCWICVVFGA
jgi:hypothetical protein